MRAGKEKNSYSAQELEPLRDTLQLGARVYEVLLNSIVSGHIKPGAALRPDVIARQLEVSTTPVREAMHRLENDGLAIKLAYQGWFVRGFTEQQIRELYELRAALESFSVRLACQRITGEEMAWLHEHQKTGEAALASGNMDDYRVYNWDLHDAIMRAAKNSYLVASMGQIRLQSEMLIAQTVGIIGRPVRAIDEHYRLIDLIEKRDAKAAEQLMEYHILSAFEDIRASVTRGA
ncbi:MAG: GntR family transcriptional regulator [Bryobacteraceae bacterium]|jgi:DNA-binding GntR family transcriptional regulator